MALQGNIETFALQDVLRLLASTKKTGCLRLDGSRGSGSLSVVDGKLVRGEASQAPHAEGAAEVLFELLRFPDGDFEFDADAEVGEIGTPAEVEPTLEAAEAMLEEWKGIEAVVPSLDHWVGLAPELPADEVAISKDRWRTVVAIAGGTSVGHLGDLLEQGELPVSRNVKELVELGLVEIDEPREGEDWSHAPTSFEAAYETEAEEPEDEGDYEEAESFDAASSFVVGSEADEEPEAEEHFDPDALIVEPEGGAESFDSYDSFVAAQTADEPAPSAVDDRPLDQSDAAVISRQLANLSPKAARAVAAAAKATTVEEREALLAQVDDDEDPINRDLLIKFLGSVNS